MYQELLSSAPLLPNSKYVVDKGIKIGNHIYCYWNPSIKSTFNMIENNTILCYDAKQDVFVLRSNDGRHLPATIVNKLYINVQTGECVAYYIGPNSQYTEWISTKEIWTALGWHILSQSSEPIIGWKVR